MLYGYFCMKEISCLCGAVEDSILTSYLEDGILSRSEWIFLQKFMVCCWAIILNIFFVKPEACYIVMSTRKRYIGHVFSSSYLEIIP